MNKNKGFTLVELLSVLFILSIVALITLSVINNQVDETAEKLYKTQIQKIELSAKQWGSENFTSLPHVENDSIVITIGQLKEFGVLDRQLKNPKTKKLFSDDIEIKITKIGKVHKYEVIID